MLIGSQSIRIKDESGTHSRSQPGLYFISITN